MHKGANRLVKDVARIGEDQLEIRIDFFVYFAKNMAGDAKLGRISKVTLGLPHEMAFINSLAKGVLEVKPFAHADLTELEGIDETHEFYEPHGFGYCEWYRQREQKRKASDARAAAAAKGSTGGSSSPAPPVAGGSRFTSAKKGVKQNLLNANPLKPTTPAEIELMMECVTEAQKKSSKKKGKSKAVNVWTIAADIYREKVKQSVVISSNQ
jgi:hypothetical protein